MSISKNILSDALVVTAFVAILFLAQEAAAEIKAYEEPDYSDVAGCSPDLTYYGALCG